MVCLYFLYISTEKAVLDVLKVFYNDTLDLHPRITDKIERINL